MKWTLVLLVAVACGCAGHRDPLAVEEKRRASLEMQSILDMVVSRQIPPVEFKTDSDELLPSSFDMLNRVAQVLLRYPKLKLIVEGHADDVGSFEYNDNLSLRRAGSVKLYLVKQGIYPDFIRVYGFGKRRRLTEDTSDRGRALNRRVEFKITDRDWESVF